MDSSSFNHARDHQRIKRQQQASDVNNNSTIEQQTTVRELNHKFLNLRFRKSIIKCVDKYKVILKR